MEDSLESYCYMIKKYSYQKSEFLNFLLFLLSLLDLIHILICSTKIGGESNMKNSWATRLCCLPQARTFLLFK